MPFSKASLSTLLRPATTAGLVAVALIGLPFAAIGTAMAYRVMWIVVSAFTMQSWPTVPATLQQVELKNEGSTSVRARATYVYSVNGQQYTGKRASLYAADNIGSFHKRAAEELEGYMSRHEPYPAHVNPKDPTQAVLIPVVRWDVVAFDLVFVVLFGGAGWGLPISSFLHWRRLRKESALTAQFPDEPWRQRVEWSTNRIKSSEGAGALGAACAAVFCVAASFPMLFAVPEKIRNQEYRGLLLLVFPIVGAGFAIWAGAKVARAIRSRGTYLELETFPARQGEQLRGRLSGPAALADYGGAKVVMRCERNYRAGGTSKSEDRTETMWEQAGIADVVPGAGEPGRTMVAFEFLVPDSLPDSLRALPEGYSWQITASAALQGANFEAEFEVPVFSR